MKLEVIILAITSCAIANVYYDGLLLSKIKEYKKHGQMGMYAFVGLTIYLFIRKDPSKTQAILSDPQARTSRRLATTRP